MYIGRSDALLKMPLVALFIALDILGWSAACDRDGGCIPDYPDIQNSVHDNGCPAWNAALCGKWRLYADCLEEFALADECEEYRFELSTRKAATRNLLDCHCNWNSTPTADVPKASFCSQTFESYTACVLFGDPHLITVSGNEQTCSLPGKHRLLEYGEDLTVDVVNVKVAPWLNATGTSKVIVRYGSSRCVGGDGLEFTATALDFRPVFDDGTSAKHLINVSDSNLIELKADWLGVKVLVRRAGMYLSVSVRLPSGTKSLVSGLCQSGCPTDHLLPDKLSSSQQVVAEHIALYACDHLEEESFFFKSCVFDVKMTGNRNFTEAALKALNDFNTLRSPVSSNASPMLAKYTALLPVTILYYCLFYM